MKVIEIFQSIDGEGPRMGLIANFIRLSGCNLRCSYCDTTYALDSNNGADMTIPMILEKLDQKIKNVTLTGGEPLYNKEEVCDLIEVLFKEGYNVSIETNGSIDLTNYINRFNLVCYIVDYKCPGSGMEENMFVQNFNILRNTDVVKFVVKDNYDLEKVKILSKKIKAQIFVSPVFGEIDLTEIVDFLKDNHLNNVRLQVQLHKIIWDKDERGV